MLHPQVHYAYERHDSKRDSLFSSSCLTDTRPVSLRPNRFEKSCCGATLNMNDQILRVLYED
jgi:hypothetical protein